MQIAYQHPLLSMIFCLLHLRH